MTINETLQHVYQLYPSIRAWVISGERGPWSDAASAKLHLRRYVGPHTEYIVLEAAHIRDEADISFLRTQEALDALCAVVDAVYTLRPLDGGLFPVGGSSG